MTASFPRMISLLAAAGLALLLGVGGFLFFHSRKDSNGSSNQNPVPEPEATAVDRKHDRSASFRESAHESGINFRMAFLPGEQGAKFKVNLYDHGCGVAVGDYDNDGHDDVYFTNQLGENALYRNNGDGTFTDVTHKAGVAVGDRICVAAAFGDYDNDGYPDLYVTSTRGGNLLFHNNRNGTFTDVTEQAGLVHRGHSQTAAFFDYDNDGYLDLIVTNTAKWTLDDYNSSSHYFPGLERLTALTASTPEYNRFYRNKGNGTFEDVTDAAGLKGRGWGGDVAIFDYNGDGWMDLFVTNMFGANQLYRNNRNRTFTDVTKDVLGRTSFGAIGSKAFDFNNDGRLDLLIVDMHSDMWLPPWIEPSSTQYNLKVKYSRFAGPFYDIDAKVADEEKRVQDAVHFRYEDVIFGNTLFKHLPSGKFAEVSDKANMETWWPWGIAIGDFNNDGYEDVYLPSGMGFPYGYWPSALLMNNGDETFTDHAEQAGIEPPPGGRDLPDQIADRPAARSSRCAAVADFDGDGRLDLVVNNFNDHPYYFRNHYPKKNYIAFRLQGTKSNRDAVGALVRLYVGKEVMVRQVHAAGGYLSQSSLAVHFGLGERKQVDHVEIRWPSGTVERIDKPEINKLHRRKEPAEK